MTPEEKYKNAIELFRHYHQSKGKEEIQISNQILEEYGLGKDDFWEIICPRLKKQGILKNFSPEKLYILPNQIEAGQIISKWSPGGFGSYDFIGHPQEMEKAKADDFKRLNSLKRFYKFTVNKDKLAEQNERKRSGKLKTAGQEQKLEIVRSLIKIAEFYHAPDNIQGQRSRVMKSALEFLKETRLDEYENPKQIFEVIIAESDGAIVADEMVSGINLQRLQPGQHEVGGYGYIYITIDREKLEHFRDKLNRDLSDKIHTEDSSVTQLKYIRPYCLVEGIWGYLKFGKFGNKIKIGGANSQPFKLLKCLTEPFGVAKSVEVIFEALRENMKHKSKSGVYTGGTDKSQKVKIIEYAVKELQKGNKMRGKLVFRWDDLKIKIWLEYLG